VKKSELTILSVPLAVKTPDEWETARLATFEVRGQDERHGKFSLWHANGQLARQGEFHYDLPVGKITYWFASGQKQLEGTYVDGRAHGAWTWWHENGQKAISGEYQEAQPAGQWSWWTDAGQLAHSTHLVEPSGRHTPPEARATIREAKLPAGLPLR
jgi:antitoxin component YwqK of YwqJK toxin-antitoxin module